LIDTGGDEFIHRISGKTAGLVIGDRALEQRLKHPYIYDLGEAWKNFSGLGFVFAAWISNKKIDPLFLDHFNAANEFGLKHLPEIINENPYPHFDLHDYYTQYISYFINNEKRKGLDLFLAMMNDQK
jgi:chorismate dehydratase